MTAPRRLPDLLAAAGVRDAGPVPDLPIAWVTDDSRRVRPDTLFIALAGGRSDGHRFLEQAVRAGARVLLVENGARIPEGAVGIRVKATRPLLGPILHAFWGSPSEWLRMAGVTGTNGKTTVAWFIRHLLDRAGFPCGLLGTVCGRVGPEVRPALLTTPRPTELQELLAEMARAGLEFCAMEVSSHALDQGRTAGIRWKAGVFTNVAPEHLDYHGDLSAYRAAKRRLFEDLDGQSWAVLNRQEEVFEEFRRAAAPARVLTYGLGPPADLYARDVRYSLEGACGTWVTPEGEFPLELRLIGAFNLMNAAAAVGAAGVLGVPYHQAVREAAAFQGVPGRLERIETGRGFPVFVDYAHTDGALREVLRALRSVTDRKIITLFGCGGDRDRAKRPRMGRVASELSDALVVTSDNPRSEEPEKIVCDILSGVERELPVDVVLDRREAIRRALELAGGKSLVLIAGKGHETVQVFRDRTVPFNDRETVMEALKLVHA